MMLTEETTFADAALPLAEFKAHLTIGSGFADSGAQDVTLLSYLRAAVSAIEARTGKALIERSFAWTVYEWRDPAGAPLPVAPVVTLTGLDRVDADGAATALSLTSVRVEADTHRPMLRPRTGSLPSAPSGGSVVLRFDAGMAPAWGGLPSDLGHAVMLLAAHYYEYRDDTALGDGCMPFGVSSLVQRYRPMRLHLGASA